MELKPLKRDMGAPAGLAKPKVLKAQANAVLERSDCLL
jgi:hypothetical protein